MAEYYIDIIGYVGAFFLSLMFIPQIIHIYRSKQALSISYQSQIMSLISSTIMLVYGILLNSLPIMISNSFIILSVMIIICLKYKFESVKPSQLE